MSSITNSDKVDFEQHAQAAIKVDRLREMVVEEFDTLDNAQTQILDQIKAIETTVKAMFARKGKTH
jgi:hypothetical protein